MRKIIGAAIGSCIHVAGVHNFLELATEEEYEGIYLGGAISIKKLIDAIIETDPEYVTIGYRLGWESLEILLKELEDALKETNLLKNKKYIFGGTIETAKIAERFSFFDKIFNGLEEPEEPLLYLRGLESKGEKLKNSKNLMERINQKSPFPLFRHHIGLGTLQETSLEIKKLSESKLLDIISLAPDQNCQEFYFEPEKMNKKEDGAGGAPIRTIKDLKMMYDMTQTGNFPLLRCYSGTDNILKFTKILKENINNAFMSVPLFWYSELDRRSTRKLEKAIEENQKVIKWNAENNIPVEINESHHWSLRYGHDALEVAMTYLVTYNAKHLGVKEYILQFMLNNPPKISPKMDIAKMLAKIEVIGELLDDKFKLIKMIRTGLLSYPADEDAAKGQLASSIFYGAFLQPDIIHVVSYCEAVKRATSKEIIESIKIAKRSYLLASEGLPNFKEDKEVKERIKELIREAKVILDAIKQIGDKTEKSLMDPKILSEAVKIGIIDAPCLGGFGDAKGKLKTKFINGANYAIDDNGKKLKEEDRIKNLFNKKN